MVRWIMKVIHKSPILKGLNRMYLSLTGLVRIIKLIECGK
jgi:hypothetical protein